jgi:hypothetical protein
MHKSLRSLKSYIPEESFEEIIKEQQVVWNPQKRFPTINLEEMFGDINKNSIVLDKFLGQWGNMSIESVCKLCLIIKQIKPLRILEIGTYNGLTTLQMAMNTVEGCQVYTLDLPDGEYSECGSKLDKELSITLRQTGEYFHGHLMESKITQLIGNSQTFDFSAYYDSMDLVFIDGGHDYQTKEIDTINGLKLIKKGGVLVWDNYLDQLNPDVTTFLNQLDLPIYHLRNTFLAIYLKT